MGRPEEVVKVEESHTGQWLAPLLRRRDESEIRSPRIGTALEDIEPISRQLAL
jgi:hypothetical protein